MGNIANVYCPMCHSHDVNRIWVNGNSYLQCAMCGERFH